MENKLKYDVQICSVSSTGGGESTIKFGCSSRTLAEIEAFVDKEILLKFALERAEDEEMSGYIYNVHSSYGGKIPRYFTVKLDSSYKIKAGQLLALTGEEVKLIVIVPEPEESEGEETEETPAM